MVDRSIRITVRVEPEPMAEIEDPLRIEMEQGREMSVAAFIRMAVRRLVLEEGQGLKMTPEIKS